MKTIIIAAAILGALAVALGAFGAHQLEARLAPQQLNTYQKAVQYHFYHVFALLAVAALYTKLPASGASWTAALFTIGIILFSGSLYLWSTRTLLGIEHWRFLVFFTPIGGLFFISGWISLAWHALRSNSL